MNEIQKHEPMLEVEFKNGTYQYIPLNQKGMLLDQMNTQKFIDINGIIINTLQINYVRPAKEAVDWTRGLDEQEVNTIKMRIKTFEKNISKSPSSETICKWIAKMKRGEDLNN